MSCWQYARLTIAVNVRAVPGARTILWHGPGQGAGENYSDSDQTVLELLNRFEADSWAASRTTARVGTGPATGKRPGCSRCTPSASSPRYSPRVISAPLLGGPTLTLKRQSTVA
jgi:hypothetical protein